MVSSWRRGWAAAWAGQVEPLGQVGHVDFRARRPLVRLGDHLGQLIEITGPGIGVEPIEGRLGETADLPRVPPR